MLGLCSLHYYIVLLIFVTRSVSKISSPDFGIYSLQRDAPPQRDMRLGKRTGQSDTGPHAPLTPERFDIPPQSVTEGSALIKSWLGLRATCQTGYYSCGATSTVCCLSGYCCTLTGCVKDLGGGCCNGITCEAGWSCCENTGCYPRTGQCCSNGQYCTAGNICVLISGAIRCCTNTQCTAYVSNGINYGPTSSITTSSRSSTTSTTSSSSSRSTTSPTSSTTSTSSKPSSLTSTIASPTPPPTTPVPSPSSTQASSGLSLENRIALGVGIGFGVPATVAGVWMCVQGILRHRP